MDRRALLLDERRAPALPAARCSPNDTRRSRDIESARTGPPSSRAQTRVPRAEKPSGASRIRIRGHCRAHAWSPRFRRYAYTYDPTFGRRTEDAPACLFGQQHLPGRAATSGLCWLPAPKCNPRCPPRQSRRSSRRTPKKRTIMPAHRNHRGGTMPTYLSPGVYVEETDSGSRPIEGVGTAVAAFVGLAEKGPFNQPTLISNWTQFTQTFGGFDRRCLPGAIRLRVLPERWRELLHRPHRRRRGRKRFSRNPAGDRGGAAGRTCQLPGRRPGPQDAPGQPAGGDRRIPQRRRGRPERGLKLVVYRDGQVVEEHPGITTSRGKDQRRHRRQRGIADREARTRSAASPPKNFTPACRSRSRRRPPLRWRPRRRGSTATTTSATSKNAAASRAWRRSTKSPWSACRI